MPMYRTGSGRNGIRKNRKGKNLWPHRIRTVNQSLADLAAETFRYNFYHKGEQDYTSLTTFFPGVGVVGTAPAHQISKGPAQSVVSATTSSSSTSSSTSSTSSSVNAVGATSSSDEHTLAQRPDPGQQFNHIHKRPNPETSNHHNETRPDPLAQEEQKLEAIQNTIYGYIHAIQPIGRPPPPNSIRPPNASPVGSVTTKDPWAHLFDDPNSRPTSAKPTKQSL